MAQTDINILKQFAEKIVPEIEAVSGRFADSIEFEVDKDGLEITASPYITTLIDGRPPTSIGAKKGSPTLQQIIRAWIDEKSIVPTPNQAGKTPSKESLSWAISQSIHKYGDLLYQRGGGNNIFEGVITEDRLNSLLNLIGEKYFNEINSINKIQIST